jgi:two-component system sensor histidine kinase PilS (NtrC family)
VAHGERALGVSISPLLDASGQVQGRIVSFQDLTELRRMEEAVSRSERLAAIGRLAAGVAHEIRNPLASISGAVQVLRDDSDRGGEERELMELIVSESDRLNRIIEGVLDYTRDHSGSRRIHDVSMTAREVVRLLATTRNCCSGRPSSSSSPPVATTAPKWRRAGSSRCS